MTAASKGHRQHLLDGLRRFVTSVRQMPGVKRIAVLGSIVTTSQIRRTSMCLSWSPTMPT